MTVNHWRLSPDLTALYETADPANQDALALEEAEVEYASANFMLQVELSLDDARMLIAGLDAVMSTMSEAVVFGDRIDCDLSIGHGEATQINLVSNMVGDWINAVELCRERFLGQVSVSLAQGMDDEEDPGDSPEDRKYYRSLCENGPNVETRY